MNTVVIQFIRLRFYEVFELLKNLLLPGKPRESEGNQISEIIAIEEQFTVGSVWIKRKEDPRLDPSLGGRDPTFRVTETKRRNFKSTKPIKEIR